MQKYIRHLTIRALYYSIDIFFIFLSLYLAFVLRQAETLPFHVDSTNFLTESTNPFRPWILIWLPCQLFMNQVYNLYYTQREVSETLEISAIIKSVLSAAAVMFIARYWLRLEDLPRSVAILSVVFMVVSLSCWRILKKIVVEYLVSRGYNNFNTLIIGAGKVGVCLHQEIAKRPGLGLNVVGYLDDFKSGVIEGKKVLGGLGDFERLAKHEFIHKIFITVYKDNDSFVRILEVANELGIAVRVVPQGFEFMRDKFNLYTIGSIPILEYSDSGTKYRQTGKRLFDLCAGSLMFMLVLPILVLIGIMVKLDSSGPVFFRSKRYGRGGKIFHMIKFRSMVADAPEKLKELKEKNEADGPIFKMKNDPRITRLGRFLRKYSLDELPQVINVLLGDMSLVGPRPLPIDQIEKEDLRQLKRLDIHPGITGLWQIRGRSELSFERLVKWDIWYINNWSLKLDLYILVQTIPAVFKGSGAY